ncbi:MAG: hypothetical protein IJ459_01305 [Clostridia bacterium]|nr:hypothetical protein [Clostridia bacterium]
MDNYGKLPPEGGEDRSTELLEDCSYATEKYTKPKTFGEWLSNFWYHYKWHTVVGVVVLALAAVLIGQIATREEYDIGIIYAGGHSFSRLSSNGELPSYNVAVQSLCKVCPDFDGDGKINVTLKDHYVLTEREIAELREAGRGDSINEALIETDSNDLSTAIISGEYNVLFLSEALYSELDLRYDGGLFADLTGYLKEGAEYEFAGGDTRAVYLKSLGISSLPELENLPDDTVVCLRKLTLDLTFGTGKVEEKYENAVTVIKNILSYKK